MARGRYSGQDAEDRWDAITVLFQNHTRRKMGYARDTTDLMRAARVLVAYDYEPWRRCVSSLFSKHPEWQIVGEVSDGMQAVQRAHELKPDLVLMDLSLPKLNGV